MAFGERVLIRGGGLWWEGPYKRSGIWWEGPYKRDTTVEVRILKWWAKTSFQIICPTQFVFISLYILTSMFKPSNICLLFLLWNQSPYINITSIKIYFIYSRSQTSFNYSLLSTTRSLMSLIHQNSQSSTLTFWSSSTSLSSEQDDDAAIKEEKQIIISYVNLP